MNEARADNQVFGARADGFRTWVTLAVFLPGLPTTMFWIIAAVAFLRTNKRMPGSSRINALAQAYACSLKKAAYAGAALAGSALVSLLPTPESAARPAVAAPANER